MITYRCDICLKEIPYGSQVHICEKHFQFAEQFYRDQAEAVRKAIEAHRSRFLQNVVNKPRPLEVAK
jgi:hypothetical protein